MKISAKYAQRLEMIVRERFGGTESGSVVGVADAYILEGNPIYAVIAVFSPLYLKEECIPEIERFFYEYAGIFSMIGDRYCSDELSGEFVDAFENLVKKYPLSQ